MNAATIAVINDGDTPHNGPSEQVEAKYPLLKVESHARCARIPGGAGKHRGGLGTEQTVRVLNDIGFNAQIERVDCRPWGLFGGLSALGNEVQLQRNGEDIPFSDRARCWGNSSRRATPIPCAPAAAAAAARRSTASSTTSRTMCGRATCRPKPRISSMASSSTPTAARTARAARPCGATMRRRGLAEVDRPFVRARISSRFGCPALCLPEARSARRADAAGRRRGVAGLAQFPLLLRALDATDIPSTAQRGQRAAPGRHDCLGRARIRDRRDAGRSRGVERALPTSRGISTSTRRSQGGTAGDPGAARYRVAGCCGAALQSHLPHQQSRPAPVAENPVAGSVRLGAEGAGRRDRRTGAPRRCGRKR